MLKHQDIISSSLCQPAPWPSDMDKVAELFYTQITDILDILIRSQQVVRHQGSLDAWFNAECREAERLTRRLGLAHAAAVLRCSLQLPGDPVSATRANDAKAVWCAQR